jgi:hypothetical protein
MTTSHLMMFNPANKQVLRMAQTRFTPCAYAGLLLKRTAVTAKRTSGGEMVLFLRANSRFDQFQNRPRRAGQDRPMNKLLLTSREVFRGKISRPETQPNLNERTQSAPNR